MEFKQYMSGGSADCWQLEVAGVPVEVPDEFPEFITSLPRNLRVYLDDNFDITASSVWADDCIANLGYVSASEVVFVRTQRSLFCERAIRKQAAIQRDLAEARYSGNFTKIRECLVELQRLNRAGWNFASVLKQKVLVKRKGTERSSSKSGCQTVCTHTIAIFEDDTLARWLIGLLAKFFRTSDASQNAVIQSGPARAATRRQSGTPSFNFCAA